MMVAMAWLECRHQGTQTVGHTANWPSTLFVIRADPVEIFWWLGGDGNGGVVGWGGGGGVVKRAVVSIFS